MLNLMIKNICENSNRIDTVVKHVNKNNIRVSIQILLLTISIGVVTKTVKKHETQINELKLELEEMKSKGE